nr:hypothetical protein BaRGS_022239 [Batillaria attramentaria]
MTDIPKSVWKLLKIPAFVLLVLTGVVEVLLFSSISSFGTKLFEENFQLTATMAGLAMDGITYFSPCHAGCLGKENVTLQVSCHKKGRQKQQQRSASYGGEVTRGRCGPVGPCSKFYIALPFMILGVVFRRFLSSEVMDSVPKAIALSATPPLRYVSDFSEDEKSDVEDGGQGKFDKHRGSKG